MEYSWKRAATRERESSAAIPQMHYLRFSFLFAYSLRLVVVVVRLLLGNAQKNPTWHPAFNGANTSTRSSSTITRATQRSPGSTSDRLPASYAAFPVSFCPLYTLSNPSFSLSSCLLRLRLYYRYFHFLHDAKTYSIWPSLSYKRSHWEACSDF